MSFPAHNKITIFKHIYKQSAPNLIRFAAKFVHKDTAEDIVQDVFLKFWDKNLFDMPEDILSKYLFSSVKNMCINHLEHLLVEENYANQRKVGLSLQELEQYDSVEKMIVKQDLYNHVLTLIDELPPKQKEIFNLAYLESKKSSEIAEMLGLSVRTVENHIYRSILQLRKKMKSELFILMLYFIDL